MPLNSDLGAQAGPAVVGRGDGAEQPPRQGDHSPPVEHVGGVPEGLPAGPGARRRLVLELEPQGRAEGAADGEVNGQVHHSQQDPDVVRRGGTWPQSGHRTDRGGGVREGEEDVENC